MDRPGIALSAGFCVCIAALIVDAIDVLTTAGSPHVSQLVSADQLIALGRPRSSELTYLQKHTARKRALTIHTAHYRFSLTFRDADS
jgi:hypothetical protein